MSRGSKRWRRGGTSSTQVHLNLSCRHDGLLSLIHVISLGSKKDGYTDKDPPSFYSDLLEALLPCPKSSTRYHG